MSAMRTARTSFQRIEAWLAGLRLPVPSWVFGTAAIAALSSFAIRALFGGGLIVNGDTLHVWRVFQMHRCLDDGQWPCRWVPDMGNGYGFPLFNYYPPLPYYVGDALHRLGFSYLATVDALYVIGIVAAGLSMYAFARRLWGELGGLVSGVAYMYAPYLALDVYVRGALAELWALAVLPALLWSVYEVVTSGDRRWVPLLALFTALLLLSHNLVAMIASPAIVVWAAALLYLRRNDALRPALLGAAGAIWGVGLASFFTLPALFERGHVQIEHLISWPFFRYDDHFSTAGDLFLRRTADYGYLLGLQPDPPVQIGWYHWAIAGLSLPAAYVLARRGDRAGAIASGLFALAFAFGVFMTLSVSDFIWRSFEPLHYLQFPWRYLGLVSLGAAGLAGAWLAVLRDRSRALQLGLSTLLIGVFIGSGYVFFDPLTRFDADDEYMLTGVEGAFYAGGSIEDYLPDAVDVIPDARDDPARVAAGTAQVEELDSGSDWLLLRVEAPAQAWIEASLFEYPDWRVEIDGREVQHTVSPPHGLVLFSVPPGVHEVELRLQDTAVRKTGNVVSLVSWTGLVVVGLTMAAGPLRRAWRR